MRISYIGENMTNQPTKQILRFPLEQAGTVLVAVSVLVLVFTFWPVLKEEIVYQFSPKKTLRPVVLQAEQTGTVTPSVIVPVNEDFGIVIPKIGANAAIVPDVNWEDARAYQQALTKGVAHARGTAYPGELGNVFLFSHSGVDFFEATRYNAIFYLIDKLVPGDEIILLYQKQKLTYRVTEKKSVSQEQIEYLSGDPSKKTLTLMTCWPAGTTLKRLLVLAEQVDTL